MVGEEGVDEPDRGLTAYGEAEWAITADEIASRPGGAAEKLVLRTTRFDTLRWRLGRRSRAQLARLDWSADPQPVLDDAGDEVCRAIADWWPTATG